MEYNELQKNSDTSAEEPEEDEGNFYAKIRDKIKVCKLYKSLIIITGPADPVNAGLDETMVYNERGAVIGHRIAPAEGNMPIALHADTDAEILSFPTIYAGQRRNIPDD